ncbi:hypothetical protein GCM10023217_00090 [Gordonia alkaliphila]|uniref:Uncharacterized protein n=1 Tax=Gordonia alkaliphila TaxID=1053547 RepID=A0ABP8YSN9_9ACTN
MFGARRDPQALTGGQVPELVSGADFAEASFGPEERVLAVAVRLFHAAVEVSDVAVGRRARGEQESGRNESCVGGRGWWAAATNNLSYR